MKRAASSGASKSYVCRKCVRSNFKNAMEFTRHLRRCTGRAKDVPVTEFPFPVGNGTRQEIMRLRDLAQQIKEMADRLLRDLK